jgi:hypothetical protein
MALTYEPIATQTLGSAAASVTFSTIPGTYTDLVLICNAKMASNETLMLRYNSDTATNYSDTYLNGNGTAAASARTTNNTKQDLVYTGSGKNTEFFTVICNILNYTNTTTNKTTLIRSSAANSEATAIVSLWRATPAAITTITLLGNNSSNIASGSTFTLYGIKAA